MLNLSGKTILVVDDEAELRNVLKSYLELLGASVVLAGDGEVALEAARDCKVDAIVSDVRMPRLDGVGLLAALQSRPEGAPPFVFISGYSDLTPELAKAKGAFEFLAKPFSFPHLEYAIVRALGLV